MKTFKHNYRGILAIAAVSLTLSLIGASSSYADDHYRHDDRGYWDNHRHHHRYDYYNNRRGYWDQRDGVRVFISI